jgi:hypothetical protein
MAKRPRSKSGSPRDIARTRLFWRTVLVMTLGLVLVSVVYYLTSAARHRGAPADGEHRHHLAAHGGLIVSLGDDRDHYHVEAVLEQGVSLKLHTLGKDADQGLEVESQVLTARVTPEGGPGAASVVLMPVPQASDAEGQTSRFIGKLPKDLWGKQLVVSIPDLAIGGKRFPLHFTPDITPPAGGSQAQVEEEEKLYLTPSGKYPESDIRANGSQTAAQKFQGFQGAHDLRPARGDRVCPVTRIKANPKCTWVVDGRAYEFCCPPCVDEFLKTAKEQPETIKEPQQYVKG